MTNSVTGIWGDTFHSCTGLTTVTIPNSVTIIENHLRSIAVLD